MKIIVGLLLIAPLLSLITSEAVESVEWNMNCGGYLENAADASTAAIAIERLDKAIAYLEADGATKGSTGVVFHPPQNDVGYWFGNIKSARSELEGVTHGVEETNALMKLRETLLDHGEKGDHLTAPDGISAFGRNTLYFVLAWPFLLMAVVGGIVIGIELN